MELEARPVPAIVGTLLDEHALGDPCVVPRDGDELVGHAVGQLDLGGSVDDVAVLVPHAVNVDLHGAASESHALLDELAHFGVEAVLFHHVLDERIERVLSFSAPVGLIDRDARTFCPYKVGHFRAYRLRCIHAIKFALPIGMGD